MILSSIVILWNLSVVNCHAEDSEDLLNRYGMTLGGPIKHIVEDKIESIQDEIKNADFIKAEIDNYNNQQQQFKRQNQAKVKELYSDVDTILTANDTLVNTIESGITSLPINQLLSMDRTYKNNIANVNTLLGNIDFYNMTYTTKEFMYDIPELQEMLETTYAEYYESLDTYDLGDVNDVKWIMPNDRYVTSKYGTRIDPINPTVTRFHAGTDYRCSIGTEVHALFNGLVTNCGWSDTIGYFVIVQHGNNAKTLYCHLSELLVTKNQEVKQYDIIALSGGTGTRCTGPHLHLALYLNGSTYDVDKLWQ